MRQPTRNDGRFDLAELMARLAGSLIDAGSEEEIFQTIDEHFSTTVWEIEGPVLRARHTGWKDELERAVGPRPMQGDLVLPLDSAAIPPRFFDTRRFRPIPDGVGEALFRSLRDGTGRKLTEEEIQTALAAEPSPKGIFGPIFIEDTPWGLMSVRWGHPTDHELDLFTMLGSYLGVSLRLLASRRGIVRANQELRAVHTLARSRSDSSTLYLPILESAAAITDSATSALFLVDEATKRTTLAGHFGAPCEWTKGDLHGRDAYFARVFETQEPTPIEKLRPEQPAIALHPLVVENRTLGILLLARPERDFATQEMARAGLLAAQLAVQLENASLLEETRRKNEVLSSLYRLGRLLAQSREGDLPLSSALDLLVKALGYAGAWLYVREGETLVRRAESGALELPADLDLEAAVRNRESRVSKDVGGGRLLAILPLDASNHSVGCLVVAREGGELQDHDWELLESYGAQIALALERSRLGREERARVQQLRFLSQVGRIATGGRLDKRNLLRNFLEQTSLSLGFDLALGTFPASPEEETVFGADASDPIFATMRRLAFATAESLCDVREAQAVWEGETANICAMPVRGPGGIQAVFALARRTTPVSLQEFETLHAATTNLGFALEDAARFEKAQKTLDEMKLVLDVGQAITSTSNLDTLLETTARTVAQLVNATHTAMLILDEDADELRCAALHGDEPAPVRREQRFPNARKNLHRHPPVIGSPDEAPPDVRRHFERTGIQSSLAVHMKLLDEWIGCIWVMDVRAPRKWTSAEIERVEVIAHQVAIGIANARLHDDLRHSHRQLARAHEELIKKERLAALGELSAVVAHEVRNPLGVIFNSLGSLKRLIEPQGDVKTLLEIVEEESNRLDRIVSDLLDFARPNPLEQEWTDLGELVTQSLATFPIPPTIELRLEVEPELPRVYLDARLVRQALLNLIQNAIHAMPKGGPLHLWVRKDVEDERKVVKLTVEDRGLGIPDELHFRIFEPFFTTKAAGSGLGLALVKRIVEAHQGRLEFRSRVGEGSRFIIVLEALERE